MNKWRAWKFPLNEELIKTRRRLELFKMFYPLERKYERRWA
jgi:hypothetical protein